MTPDEDDKRKHAPELTCPNCGAELHAGQDLCQQCGHMRPTVSSAGASGGAAAIGCGAGLVATALSVAAFIWMSGANGPTLLVYVVEGLLAVLCFIGFRAVIARNVHARSALVAFVLVFVILFGGFAACVASLSNFRVQ